MDSLWNGHASPQSTPWYASPGVAPTTRTVPSPVALRRASGPAKTSAPGGASNDSPSTSKVTFPSSTMYSSSWPDPASSWSLTSVPSSAGTNALIPNAWIPRCSRTGISLPRRSMSSRRATFQFDVAVIRLDRNGGPSGTRRVSRTTPVPMLRIMVRDGRAEDFGPATELLNRVWPLRVGSERGLRHAAATSPPEAHRRYWAAVDDGELVG